MSKEGNFTLGSIVGIDDLVWAYSNNKNSTNSTFTKATWMTQNSLDNSKWTKTNNLVPSTSSINGIPMVPYAYLARHILNSSSYPYETVPKLTDLKTYEQAGPFILYTKVSANNEKLSFYDKDLKPSGKVYRLSVHVDTATGGGYTSTPTEIRDFIDTSVASDKKRFIDKDAVDSANEGQFVALWISFKKKTPGPVGKYYDGNIQTSAPIQTFNKIALWSRAGNSNDDDWEKVGEISSTDITGWDKPIEELGSNSPVPTEQTFVRLNFT